MDVNRSGYYKWKKRKGKKNRYETDRIILKEEIGEEHKRHPSYGYHRLDAMIRINTGWIISDSLVHKVCKSIGVKSTLKHYKYRNRGEEHKEYPNVVKGRWEAQKPLELVTSDMTCLMYRGKRWEWTYILDIFNNEIISHHVTNIEGDRRPYYACLNDLLQRIKGKTEPIVFHSDQGAVYSSRAFAEVHKNYNIIRSMSRVGTPTDNAVIESLNGWIKAELKVDFDYKNCDDLPNLLEKYVEYFNNSRPAYALGYKSPIQYRIEQGFG